MPDENGNSSEVVSARFTTQQANSIEDAKRENESRSDFVHRVVMHEVEAGPLDRFVNYLRFVAGASTAVFLIMGVLWILGSATMVAVNLSGVLAATFLISWSLARFSDVSYEIATGQ